jgi:flagellar hook-associated protein 3 FlgL
MRITHQMLADITVSNLRQNVARLESLQTAITTGQKNSRPSDDPPAVARTLTYTTDLAMGEAYLKTIDNSLTWLNATDGALGEAGSLLQRARELAVQGANGALNPGDMSAIGAEVDQLLNQMIVTGNSSLRGQRLFAGQRIDIDPFAVAGGPTGFTYTGDTGQLLREYDLGARLAINTPGQATFGPAITALTNLRNHLNAGNAPAISANDIGALDQSIDTLLSARSDVGAKTNRLEAAQSRQSLL